jgi:hypothetical protein
MAQRLLVDIDDDAYLDNMLTYLNEGQRRFAAETHCCQAIADVSVSDNVLAYSSIVSEITGAEKVLYVAKVQLNSGTQYTFLPFAPLSELKTLPTTATTTPTRYTTFAEQIVFDLHPSATISFDTTIFCSYVPSDLSSGANLIIPDQWVQAVVQYIVYLCRVSDRDAGLANGAWSEYETIRANAAAFYKAQAGA